MANARFMIYAIESGEGLASIAIPDAAEWRNLYYCNGCAIIRGEFSPATQYVCGGTVIDRPTSQAVCDRSEIAADGQDVATISGLPVPCTMQVSGPVSAEIEVTDESLEFTAAIPGEYRITVEAFPMQRYEVIIHAV